MTTPENHSAAAAAAKPPQKSSLSFSFADAGFMLKTIAHMCRTMGPDFPLSVKKLFQAKSMKERIAGLTTLFTLDPYVLQHIVHSIEGDYAFLGDTTFIPRDFDLFVRCSTELGHRGDDVPYLFDRLYQGSALNATPERYEECPYGKWELHRVIEPHFAAREHYPEQVQGMEEIIDNYMAEHLLKPIEIGTMMRLLVWDLYCFTSFGEGPNDETKHLLQLFEDYSPEFDYVLRMAASHIRSEWSDSLTAQIYGMGDWARRVTLDRERNLDKHANKTDVLTNMLRDNPGQDVARMGGALSGVFTAGMNNCHSAVVGALIANVKGGDSVYEYISDSEDGIERVVREAMRLFTAIPTTRTVREQDHFEVEGTALKPGTSVVLSTYAINTDERSWKEPMKFDASRFEGTSEMGFMCQQGFVPMGTAAELGGRACGARYHAVHMLRVILGKLLRDYKFVEVGNSRGFEMKHNAGACMYAGRCIVKVSKR